MTYNIIIIITIIIYYSVYKGDYRGAAAPEKYQPGNIDKCYIANYLFYDIIFVFFWHFTGTFLTP